MKRIRELILRSTNSAKAVKAGDARIYLKNKVFTRVSAATKSEHAKKILTIVMIAIQGAPWETTAVSSAG